MIREKSFRRELKPPVLFVKTAIIVCSLLEMYYLRLDSVKRCRATLKLGFAHDAISFWVIGNSKRRESMAN